MSARGRGAILLIALLASASHAFALDADATLEIDEDEVNALVERLGSFSEAGLYQLRAVEQSPFLDCDFFGYIECPGPPIPGSPFGDLQRIPLVRCRQGTRWVVIPGEAPVPWQWWVSDAHYRIRNGSLKFTATVKARVGDLRLAPVTREVDADVTWDDTAKRLRLSVSSFTVPIAYVRNGTLQSVTSVDVARLHGVSFALDAQTLSVPTLGSTPKRVTMEIDGVETEFQEKLLRVGFDVGFE